MKVLVLVQNPKTGANVGSPLAGTRAGRVVAAWLRVLGSPDAVVLNASRKVGKVCAADYDVATVSAALYDCDRYVALGAYASGLLERLGVAHFTLPLPSKLNRKLPDQEELRHQLALCRLYLQGPMEKESA